MFVCLMRNFKDFIDLNDTMAIIKSCPGAAERGYKATQRNRV